jgi:hypothetical protein
VGEQVGEGHLVAEEPNVVGCERAWAQTDGQRIGERKDGRADELTV